MTREPRPLPSKNFVAREELNAAIGAALFSMAQADGEVTADEMAAIISEMEKRQGHSTTNIEANLALARSLTSHRPLMKQALLTLSEDLPYQQRQKLLVAAEAVARADRKYTTAERKTFLALANELR